MAAAEAAAQQTVSAPVVGNAFVQQYYHILHHSPELVYQFYHDVRKLGRPEEDGSMSITTTMGSGFRNEGARGGRGSYGGGQGYNRGNSIGRTEFGNRGGNRRSENTSSNGGDRMDGASGMANGSSKNMPPRVSATA